MDEPTEFDKIAWSEFGRRGLAAAVRSEAEDERPSPAASNLTLSANQRYENKGLSPASGGHHRPRSGSK